MSVSINSRIGARCRLVVFADERLESFDPVFELDDVNALQVVWYGDWDSAVGVEVAGVSVAD
jgi:hypothetical protein